MFADAHSHSVRRPGGYLLITKAPGCLHVVFWDPYAKLEAVYH